MQGAGPRPQSNFTGGGNGNAGAAHAPNGGGFANGNGGTHDEAPAAAHDSSHDPESGGNV